MSCIIHLISVNCVDKRIDGRLRSRHGKILFLTKSLSMATLKTQKNDASVFDFIQSIDGEGKKADSLTLIGIFEEITGCSAKMRGKSII